MKNDSKSAGNGPQNMTKFLLINLYNIIYTKNNNLICFKFFSFTRVF